MPFELFYLIELLTSQIWIDSDDMDFFSKKEHVYEYDLDVI